MKTLLKSSTLSLLLLLTLLLAACGATPNNPAASVPTNTPNVTVTTAIAPTATVTTKANPTPTAKAVATNTPALTPSATALQDREIITTTVLKARNLTATDANLQIKGIVGDYTRVELSPTKPSNASWQGGTIFLKKMNGQWTQVLAGTAFMEEDLIKNSIPKALWTA